jgi:protein-disulfide isomerase
VFKDYPLPNHPHAPKAAEAAHCAGEQNKYWQMHDLIFAQQQTMAVPNLKVHAQTLGLDLPKFNECLDSGKHADSVNADYKYGSSLGVSSTPTMYINGRPIVGAQPFEAFQTVIDEELAAARK